MKRSVMKGRQPRAGHGGCCASGLRAFVLVLAIGVLSAGCTPAEKPRLEIEEPVASAVDDVDGGQSSDTPSDPPSDVISDSDDQVHLTPAEIAASALFETQTSKWFEPPVLERNAAGRFDLNVEMARNTLRMNGQDYRLHLRSYNRGLVGPTIRFSAGETLNVRLHNQLPVEGGHCRQDHDPADPGHDMSIPSCFNTTNLHTHGLHISPSGKSDNVLLAIRPGRHAKNPFDYRFDILPATGPDGLSGAAANTGHHYPGTFWYHAHHHGTTSVQLASGMAGALILEGDIDRYPGVEGAHERIFVLQQLAWDREGEVKSFNDILRNWRGDPPNQPDGPAGPPKHTTINGKVKPRIHLRPGQVERWRLIDAGIFEMVPLVLVSRTGRIVPLHQIAIDGITLKKVRRRSLVEMGPGYRTDVMVQAPAQEGEYLLLKQTSPFRLAAGELSEEVLQASPSLDDRQVLAVIDVAEEGLPCERDPSCFSTLIPHGAPLPWPRAMLPDITAEEVARSRRRQAVFSADRSGPPPPKFLINGREWDGSRVHPDFQLALGQAEQWRLGNTDTRTRQAHPFHIHVNAFQMLDANGQPAEWRDTIIVPSGKTLQMRTRYERFTGRFVLHCHILTHEDLGMMQLVEIR